VSAVEFAPPGKGEFRSLADHFPRALTAEYRLLLTEGMTNGDAEQFATYGVPMKTLRPFFVHGHTYLAPEPLVGNPGNGLPPFPVMWLLARAVPALRRRNAAARRAFAERIWLRDAEGWWADREGWRARCAAVEAIDVGSLDDTALAQHVVDVRALAGEGYREHFRLHGCDLIPVALLLVYALDHDLAVDEVLAQLTGASPASAGVDDPPAWRLVTGYDLDSLAACELGLQPSERGKRQRRARQPSGKPGASRVRSEAMSTASGDPEFQQLLDDARATYGVRDDNGLLTAAWPAGLLRRAMLEAGRRLGVDGVEATVDELTGALNGERAIDAGAIGARATQRAEDSLLQPPPVLGPEAGVPVKALPEPMRTMARALLAFRDVGLTDTSERPPLTGDGIGSATAAGRACVVEDPAEALARFEPGDVLVTRGTTPAWNSVLALAGGVVVEEGGPLSHAAVIARELDLPAVVGVRDALSIIPNGAEVEVDASAGTVRVV
jgi:pyruvate,water dikinase